MSLVAIWNPETPVLPNKSINLFYISINNYNYYQLFWDNKMLFYHLLNKEK